MGTRPTSPGSIIPYASGTTPVVLTTALGGFLGTTSLVGFGSAVAGVNIQNGTIDLSGLLNYSFTVPRDGVITSVAGFFTTTLGVSLIGSTATITAQLYSAPQNSNTFSPIPGASVNLSPSLTGLIGIGENSSGITSGLSIPVVAGERLLLVFSTAVTSGLPLAIALTGAASGGVSID